MMGRLSGSEAAHGWLNGVLASHPLALIISPSEDEAVHLEEL